MLPARSLLNLAWQLTVPLVLLLAAVFPGWAETTSVFVLELNDGSKVEHPISAATLLTFDDEAIVFNHKAFGPLVYYFQDLDRIWFDSREAAAAGDQAREGSAWKVLKLLQTRPNPMGGQVNIEYELEAGGEVELAVFSVSGVLVRQLVGGYQPPGAHSETWDGMSSNGDAVASGVYFYRLSCGAREVSRHLILLR